jgi:hypothetical protein
MVRAVLADAIYDANSASRDNRDRHKPHPHHTARTRTTVPDPTPPQRTNPPHHLCEALPMQLVLVRLMLQLCRRLQAATEFTKAKPPWHVLDLRSFMRLTPQMLHVQSRTHRWGGVGVVSSG